MNDDWLEKELLQPLRYEASEAFVQRVMQKVRAYAEREEWIRWPVFARWAFPALALSVASFTLALNYTLQPTKLSADTIFLQDQEPSLALAWMPLAEEP